MMRNLMILPLMLTTALTACTPAHDAPIDAYSQRFTKLGANGKPLPATAQHWACVQDERSGRVWQNLSRDEGPFHSDWTYAWHDQSLSQPVRATSGACNQRFVDACTTEAQTAYARQEKLCGFDDWRLPTTNELTTLLLPEPEPGQPSFCDCLFANTKQAGYWTADLRQTQGRPEISVIHFGSGKQQWHSPGNFFYLRLVRGG